MDVYAGGIGPETDRFHLGTRRLSEPYDEPGDRRIVMADPGGNEFGGCVGAQ